jgi:hypothetical protein
MKAVIEISTDCRQWDSIYAQASNNPNSCLCVFVCFRRLKIKAMRDYSKIFLSLLISICISLVTILLMFVFSPSWADWQQATCMPQCFCEAIGDNKLLRQPANALSSFTFVFVGVFVLILKRREKRFPAIYKTIFSAAAIAIGVGSAFYHASLTFIGQFFDVLGMYLLVVFVLVYALERLFEFTRQTTLTLYFVLNLLLATMLIYVPETRRYLFGLVLVAGLVIEIIARKTRKVIVKTKWWNIGFALFATAFVIWIVDKQKIICEPHSILQGHAVWHLLGAIAMLMLYVYYASEVTPQP